MMGFIDAHRDVYGVESICRILPIAPSTTTGAPVAVAILSGGRRGRAGMRS